MLTTILVVLVLIIFWLFLSYNKLRHMAENVKGKQANIYATVKKRQDIAQRLSDIASSYGDHEKLTHISITESDNLTDINQATSDSSRVIGNVQMLANRFPDLKANTTYQQLMIQLEEIENSILKRREDYNQAVQIYNSTRGSIPHLFYASALGFIEASYFEVDENGLDQLMSFKTDDGKILRDTMGRMATAATENVKKIKEQINKHSEIGQQEEKQ